MNGLVIYLPIKAQVEPRWSAFPEVRYDRGGGLRVPFAAAGFVTVARRKELPNVVQGGRELEYKRRNGILGRGG
jgi:hypothetical protein